MPDLSDALFSAYDAILDHVENNGTDGLCDACLHNLAGIIVAIDRWIGQHREGSEVPFPDCPVDYLVAVLEGRRKLLQADKVN